MNEWGWRYEIHLPRSGKTLPFCLKRTAKRYAAKAMHHYKKRFWLVWDNKTQRNFRVTDKTIL
jgi:hypothetical protein